MKHHRLSISLFVCALWYLSFNFATPLFASTLLEVRVKGITMDPSGQSPVVILETHDGRQALPIWIGLPEARAIALEMERVTAPRPLTHTLLQNILANLDVTVARIMIHTLRENTFYASILLQNDSTAHTIDARPSDAIALALGTRAPIFVATAVFEAAQTGAVSSQTRPPELAKKLGMHLQELDRTLAKALRLKGSAGVLVAFVEPGSRAEQVGLRRDDVITSVNGQGVASLNDFLGTLRDKTGQDIMVQVMRDRQPVILRFQLLTQE